MLDQTTDKFRHETRNRGSPRGGAWRCCRAGLCANAGTDLWTHAGGAVDVLWTVLCAANTGSPRHTSRPAYLDLHRLCTTTKRPPLTTIDENADSLASFRGNVERCVIALIERHYCS